MTDLEKLWNELEPSDPPLRAILAAARSRAVRRRRAVLRPLAATGAVAALLATFVAGTQVGGRDPSGQAARGDIVPAAFQADLDPAASCDELLTSYRDRALGLVTPWGWADAPLFGDRSGSLARLDDAAGYADGRTQEQSASATGTNVQEAGVDEPDTVKVSGARVVRARGDDVVVYDASGAQMRQISTTHLPRMETPEILLHDDTVVAIGADRVSARDAVTGQRRGTRVVTISLKNAGKPLITSDVAYSSRLISARQHGSDVRLVLAAGLPDLGFVQPSRSTTSSAEALAANRRLVETSSIGDWLPTFDTDDGEARRLLDCTDVAIPPDEVGLDTVSIVGLDLADPTVPHTIGLAGATTIAYESADHLFLAAGPSTTGCFDCLGRSTGSAVRAADGTSRVFQFDLDGVQAQHVASGEIEGSIADRWSLDEVGGVLRIAVGASSETGRFNSIVTMRRSGTELAEIGRVDGLGPDEDIKSVRWFDDLAILVTFREVDPLYSVDLTDPAAPTLLGELKIPGYSDYLHPVGDDQLLGIGYDGRGRDAQIALFDVADLANVRRTDVESFPRSRAMATADPRSFTWLADRRVALTVVERRGTVFLTTITVVGDQLTSTQTPVEFGSDATAVRTLELSDGRVVLVTGEDVRFVDVP